jgi:hypothetical protein
VRPLFLWEAKTYPGGPPAATHSPPRAKEISCADNPAVARVAHAGAERVCQLGRDCGLEL